MKLNLRSLCCTFTLYCNTHKYIWASLHLFNSWKQHYLEAIPGYSVYFQYPQILTPHLQVWFKNILLKGSFILAPKTQMPNPFLLGWILSRSWILAFLVPMWICLFPTSQTSFLCLEALTSSLVLSCVYNVLLISSQFYAILCMYQHPLYSDYNILPLCYLLMTCFLPTGCYFCWFSLPSCIPNLPLPSFPQICYKSTVCTISEFCAFRSHRVFWNHTSTEYLLDVFSLLSKLLWALWSWWNRCEDREC